MLREHAGLWRAAAELGSGELGSEARAVYEALRSRGASFFHEIVSATGQLRTQAERSLGELAGLGLVTSDSFGGLRALLAPSEKNKRRARRRRTAYKVDTAGRWSLLEGDAAADDGKRIEEIARALLSATAWFFARCSRASRACRPGGSSQRYTGGWKRAAKFAAGASSLASAASSSRR